MTKVNAEICVLEPEDTAGVVETLIKNGLAVVIRANAHDECNPTIFVHAYGVSDLPNLRDDDLHVIGISDDEQAAFHKLHDYFDQMVRPVGGAITECGPGHQDTMDGVVPPVGLQYAMDVLDDHNDILHRISCAKYTPDRAFKIAIEAAGLLANTHGRSVDNALARRLLLAALGPIEDADKDGDGDVEEVHEDRSPSAAAA